MEGMISIGEHRISEAELNQRIIDKLPKEQFADIIQDIKKDLDERVVTSTSCSCARCEAAKSGR